MVQPGDEAVPVSESVEDRVLGDLERAGCRFHALLGSLSDEDWYAASLNPAWTNGQVVYHVLFGFILVPSLYWMIAFWSRLPPGASRAFARFLDWTKPLFDRANAFGPRAQARLLGRARAQAIFDKAQGWMVRKARSLHARDWARGMHYPVRWDPTFGDFMTLADLFGYPPEHLRRHLRHLSAGDASGC